MISPNQLLFVEALDKVDFLYMKKEGTITLPELRH